MERNAQINYLRPSHYVRCEEGAWISFGPMPLYKAVLLAVRKWRINHEPCILSDGLNLVGIDAILAVRQRADFPWRVEDVRSIESNFVRRGDITRTTRSASNAPERGSEAVKGQSSKVRRKPLSEKIA